MTDGVLTKEVVVTNLAVTDINLGAYTVSGIYDPAYDLWVWLYGEDGQVPITDPDTGTWVATFAELSPGAWGGATQLETDGDGTSLDFQVPNPSLYALADENKIFAQEWIAGFPLELKIYDALGAEIYADSQVVEPPSVVPWTLVVFDLGAVDFDLLPGQRIVLSQRGYSRELIVSSLLLTGFDLDNQQVFGTGDAGAQIFIRINGEDVWGEVGSDGHWAISTNSLLQEFGAKRSSPMALMVMKPRRLILTSDDCLENWDDVAGSSGRPRSKLLTIDDPSNAQGVDYTYSQVAVDSGNLYYGNVYFEPDIELQTGYVLTMTDGNFTKTLVLSALTVTGFDFDNHIMHGTGDPGAKLLVHIGGLDSDWTIVGEDLNWSVYHELLEPGVWFRRHPTR
jgi:hypothetical protein